VNPEQFVRRKLILIANMGKSTSGPDKESQNPKNDGRGF
jgi:hypothetical protein